MATSVPGQQQSSRLFYVSDRTSGLSFLVDTGAEVSVLPPSRTERRSRQDGPGLQAVINTPIATYGERSLTLNLGLRRTLRWVFIIADVKNSILGADFLRHYGLVVDVKQNRLSDTVTQVQGILSHELSPSPTLTTTPYQTQFYSVLAEFPAITKPCNGDHPVKHDVTHHIDTKGPAVTARA